MVGQAVSGLVGIATKRREPRGMSLIVHDFWAADADTTAAIHGFLARFHTRADTVEFRRGVLPPYPTLLHGLHRYRVTARAWHPWMLRILDIGSALGMRGWPVDMTFAATIEVDTPPVPFRCRLTVADGAAAVETVEKDPEVRFTPGQFAVWYAGGYSSSATARYGGVRADSTGLLTTLIRATTHEDPWLPDLF
jgi:predicted acetyltransferase